MKITIQSSSVIVFLSIIAASCVARNLRNELNFKERLNSLIGRHQTINASCERIFSLVRNYEYNVEGAVIVMKSLISDCDIGFTFIIPVNESNFNSTSHIYSLNDTLFTVCWSSKETDFKTTGHIYFTDDKFNGTASLCSNDKGCVNVTISGDYGHFPDGSCSDFAVEAVLCRE